VPNTAATQKITS